MQGITLRWYVGLKYGKLEYWNLEILGFITPSFHYAIIPASFEGGNPCLELSKTCA
jgi:hypothetical protein